jgi:predicted ABC-type ATPase
MVAGPNGAGKTTLYETAIKDLYPDAEFINADELARKQFGRPAATLEESKFGQDAAEQRRRELMAGKNSFVTESTFSHPSKLDLLRDARAQGYEIRVYHVNVRSPELSVARVASRVERGGHPVPEEKIRERYERNQALIRDAVRMADRARVFDNSRLNEPHRIAIDFRAGQAVRVGEFVPSWARQLYADDLARFAPDRVNAPAASFKRAEAIVAERIDPNARTYIARPGGRYVGEIMGASGQHVVQRLSDRAAVAHFTDRLERVPAVGEKVVVQYPKDRGAATVREPRTPNPDRAGPSKVQQITEVLQRLDVAAERFSPGQGGVLAGALDQLRAGRREDVRALLDAQPVVLKRFDARLQELGIVAQRSTDRGQDR